MVLRKPYAFLIRHFKSIHLILTALMVIFAYKMNKIGTFLGEYKSLGTYEAERGVVWKYIGITGWLIPLLIIGLLIAILYLLKRKDKPTKYYLVSIIVYLVEFVAVIAASILLTSIQQGNANTSYVSIFKDLATSLAYLPIPFILVSLVRGVGFNIKQFNFQKDLIDLNLTEEDREEFEVQLEVDTENIRAKINRRIRFIKYVYLENKPVFFGVIALVIVAIGISIAVAISKIEHIYKPGEKFTSFGIDFVVNNAYQTNKGIDNKEIKTGKTYVIVNFTATNNTEYDTYLPFKYIYLKVDKNIQVNPTDRYEYNLSDFGNRLFSYDSIKAKSKATYNLVFEFDSTYRNNEKRFDLIELSDMGYINVKEDGHYKYAKVDLNLDKFKDTQNVKDYSLNEEVDFKNSLIDGIKLKIKSAELNNNFEVEYTLNVQNQERHYKRAIESSIPSKRMVLKLETELTKSEDFSNDLYKDFYNNLVLIQYEKDGKMIEQQFKVNDLTPNEAPVGNVYLEVTNELKDSKKVNLVFKIRNKLYTYNIINN